MTRVPPLLSILSLPAKSTGGLLVRHPVGYVTLFSGWGMVAGITIFLFGKLAFYILGNRFRYSASARFEFKSSPSSAFTISTVLLIALPIASPIPIYAICKPTTGNLVTVALAGSSMRS